MSRPSPRRRIEALARSDKVWLGGLDGVVWAPLFPRWTHRPGFWDAVHLLHYAVDPCFSAALLDIEGTAIPLHAGRSGCARDPSPRRIEPQWHPGSLTVTWTTPHGTAAVEQRRVLPGGILESSWTLPPEQAPGGSLVLVAFTAQPAEWVSGVRTSDGGVKWLRTAADRTGRELAVEMEILASRAPAWRQILSSEGGATPDWELSPFAEGGIAGGSIAGGRIDGITEPHPGDDTGWLWIAVAFPTSPEDTRTPGAQDKEPVPLVLRMRLNPRLPRPVWPRAGTQASTRSPTPTTWPSFFAGFPAFATGDPHLDRCFDYRVYGLGLNRIEGCWGNIRRPAVAEGPEYFHIPIAYSAPCHMMEMRWRTGGREAWGSLLNFVDNQKPDGSFHGRLYPNHLAHTDFYHANWGDALLAVDDMHPDGAALVRCYEGLSRYARWLNAERDPEESGMFTVVNHFETGQEYMSRYMAVDDMADVAGWRPRLRLKGIDITVYAHRLFRALAVIARRLGRTGDESGWRALQDRSAAAITEHMWCPDARLFTDVDGRTMERTGVKAAVGFYPMLAGLAGGARLDALMDHLEDPSTFGTPFPLPSSSADDPRFSAEGIWRGKRRNCPWNGRVWPMTTSHVIEGLLRCRRRGNDRAGQIAADMLPRFVRMMFTEGDPQRPNCFEHYNPYTGRACRFRGIDDYQHSWVLDLLARGIAGLHVDAEGVEVRPLPHGPVHVSMGPVTARGRTLSVALDEDRATVTVDGDPYSGPRAEPLFVGWGEVAPAERAP